MLRSFLLTASAIVAFGATMTFEFHRRQRGGLRPRRLSCRLRQHPAARLSSASLPWSAGPLDRERREGSPLHPS